MTPKPDDAKPDPLEELKEVLEEMTGYRPFQDSPGREKVNRAVAAWEKERAELARLVKFVYSETGPHASLQRAVEKVRDELRNQALEPPITATQALDHADALDAALRGGA